MSSQTFAKNSIVSRDLVDAARTMDKLHALHAKGAILNKRDWWIKWTTKPEVRAKWLAEIQETLVRAHVAHVWSQWPDRRSLPDEYDGLAVLYEIAAMTDETEKANAIESILADVKYPVFYYRFGAYEEGAHFEEADTSTVDNSNDDDDNDALALAALDPNFPYLFAAHKKMRPFCQIAWYVTMTILREQLRALSLREWTRERVVPLTQQIWSSENQEVVDRTSQLILATLRDGDCTAEVLRNHFPHETRPTVLRLLQCHFAKIPAILNTAVTSIESDLQILINELDLSPSEEPVVYVPGPAPRTWMSDNCIPAEFKTKFVAEIAALENVPDEMKDWHPSTNNQVLNLVHPSLFCGVVDKTKVLAAAEADVLYDDPATHMQAIMFANTEKPLCRPGWMAGAYSMRPGFYQSDFQWLPCEIDVAESSNSARIRTYINNLHPEDHPGLYDSIGDIFGRFVPLFDQVLSTLVDPQAPPAYQPTPRYSLAGSRCQVIVKIAEIVLTPEEPNYDGGSWHVEGTDAENIVATGLYYFGCENITESRLSFCSFVNPPTSIDATDHIGWALSYGLYNGKAMVQNMGDVTALEDRCVVFPNCLHHKVEPFRLADPTKPGVRKILAFFLVNPTTDPIPSTAIVPPQQEEWVARAQRSALESLRIPEAVKSEIGDMVRDAGDQMTLEEAKKFRLDLMRERSSVTLQGFAQDKGYVISLCEH